MSGTTNAPSRSGEAQALQLVERIIDVCDGHDTVDVLTALTTVCAISLDDIGVDVEVFVRRIRVDATKIKRARKARAG